MAATKKKKHVEITIPPRVTHEFAITLVGTGILVCNSAIHVPKGLRDKRILGEKPARRKPQTKEEYERECHEAYMAARYRMSTGQDGFPAVTIKYAIVDECTFVEGPEKTKMRAAITINDGDFLCPIFHDAKEPVMREDFVRVGGKAGRGSGQASLAYRPEYRNWRIPIVITYDPTLVTVQMIVNLVDLSGFHQGIGEWRKPKGGEWGRFTIEEGHNIPVDLYPRLSSVKTKAGKKAAKKAA